MYKDLLMMLLPACSGSGRMGSDGCMVFGLDLNTGDYYHPNNAKTPLPDMIERDTSTLKGRDHEVWLKDAKEAVKNLAMEKNPSISFSDPLSQRGMMMFTEVEAGNIQIKDVNLDKLLASWFIDFGCGNWFHNCGVVSMPIKEPHAAR